MTLLVTKMSMKNIRGNLKTYKNTQILLISDKGHFRGKRGGGGRVTKLNPFGKDIEKNPSGRIFGMDMGIFLGRIFWKDREGWKDNRKYLLDKCMLYIRCIITIM